MDEATIKIVMEDGGSFGASPPPAMPSSTPEPFMSRWTGQASSGADGGRGRPRRGQDEPLDPFQAALKRLQREQATKDIDEWYRRLNPQQGKFDPVGEARKRLQQEQEAAAIGAELLKLKGGPEKFDPAVVAKERFAKEKQAAAVDAELARLRGPGAAFNPLAEAKKRLEREKQAAAVDAEFRKLRGKTAEEEAEFYSALKGRIGAFSGAAAQGGQAFGAAGAGEGALAFGVNALSMSGGPFGVMLTAANLAAAAFGAALREEIAIVRAEGNANAGLIASGNQLKNEIDQNRIVLRRMEAIPFHQFSPAYIDLQRKVAANEAALEAFGATAQRIGRVAPFSADTAAAQARANAFGMQTQIAEAQFLGPNYAEFLEKQGRVGAMNQQIEALRQFNTQLNATMQGMNAQLDGLQGLLKEQAKAAEANIRQQAEDQKKRAQTDEERKEIDREMTLQLQRLNDFLQGKVDIMDNALRLFDDMNIPNPAQQPDFVQLGDAALVGAMIRAPAFDVR